MPQSNDNAPMLDVTGYGIAVMALLGVFAAALLKRGLISRAEIEHGIDHVKHTIDPKWTAGAGFAFETFEILLNRMSDPVGSDPPSWKNAERPAPPGWFRGVIEEGGNDQ
jgi:hypothetical protein